MKKIGILLVLLFFSLGSILNAQKSKAYQNTELSTDDRVEDLLSRMTLEEKFWQLFMIPGDLSDGKARYKNGIFGFQVSTKGKSGDGAEQLLDYSGGGNAVETARLINEIQRYFVEETRLGIPIIAFDETLHGLIREDATAFPQAIGLASTWDTALMHEVANAIAMETKSRGIRQVLSPVVNIARDVRWGRTEETYGEDPFLTSQMGTAYMSAFEELDVITTPKHFVANVGDGGRDSYPIHFNERILEEIYFPAFKAAIKDGGARSIMTSYNSVDGRQATANDWLLNKKLKEEWGFDGFVISDAGATGGANVLHFTAKDYAESTEQAIENGLDVIFQTSYDHYPLFFEAFEKGMIDETAINNSVRRVLKAKFDLGLFEDPYVDVREAEKWNNSEAHKKLARKAAVESVVLLKNENSVLPIKKDIRSIALIGADANNVRLGGYSGPGNDLVSIRKGLEMANSNVKISFSEGVGLENNEFQVIPEEHFFHEEHGELKAGLSAAYYNNTDLSGDPALKRIDKNIDFGWTLFSPDQEKINYDWYSVNWTGKLKAPETGKFKIGFEGDDGYKLYLDGRLLIDNWRKQTYRTVTHEIDLKKDELYDLKIEFFETTGNTKLKMVWNQGVINDWEKRIEDAVKLASENELAIVVAGIHEGEFQDRALLSLPGKQEELILKVAEANPNTVVILVGGSAITMTKWIDQVPAILDIWYPGEQGGHAVADILYGYQNPAGRLPITFPVHEAQLPLYYNHKPTGRGDDYYNLTGKPLFPFGFGLSYTEFEYSDLQLSKKILDENEEIQLSFQLKNTGEHDGDEVIQMYIKDLYASVARPVMELKGFQRIHLKKGEERTVQFKIGQKELEMLDINMKKVVEPGVFRIMIGASSKDIRLREHIEVK